MFPAIAPPPSAARYAFVVSDRTQLDQLTTWIDELARKWERYVTRDPHVPVPPERERAALERRLKELSRAEPPGASDRFRLEQLMHRFSTYNQLWQRQLREREVGIQAGAAAPVALGSAGARAVNAAGLASVASVEPDDVAPLHARYMESLRARGAGADVSLERFKEALARERSRLESQGSVVEGFEVIEEGGAVRVRARLRRRRQE